MKDVATPQTADFVARSMTSTCRKCAQPIHKNGKIWAHQSTLADCHANADWLREFSPSEIVGPRK